MRHCTTCLLLAEKAKPLTRLIAPPDHSRIYRPAVYSSDNKNAAGKPTMVLGEGTISPQDLSGQMAAFGIGHGGYEGRLWAVSQQAYSSGRRFANQASKLSRARSVSNGAKVFGFALYRPCLISVNEFIVPLSGLASNSAL